MHTETRGPFPPGERGYSWTCPARRKPGAGKRETIGPMRTSRSARYRAVTGRGRAARACGAVLGVLAALGLPAAAAAHGDVVPPAPDLGGLLFGWSLDPTIWIPLIGVGSAYLWAVRRIDREHPASPVPRDRPACFVLGLVAIAVALQSGIERWDTTLFSVHMVQHLVLIFVAAPLLVLGAPITVLLRVATPETRRRRILPVLNSRVVRVIGHPLVAWVLFAVVMWGSHLSPLFDAALESAALHDLEHLLYLGSAVLFFWPVVGRDPGPHRMGFPARLFYLFLQMPLNSFLGVVILFAEHPLYVHYATTGRTWGPSALDDQQAAGAIMWGAGDGGFLIALLLVIAAWMRFDEADTQRREALEDARAAQGVGEPAQGGAAVAQGVPPGEAAQPQAKGGIGAAR